MPSTCCFSAFWYQFIACVYIFQRPPPSTDRMGSIQLPASSAPRREGCVLIFIDLQLKNIESQSPPATVGRRAGCKHEQDRVRALGSYVRNLFVVQYYGTIEEARFADPGSLHRITQVVLDHNSHLVRVERRVREALMAHVGASETLRQLVQSLNFDWLVGALFLAENHTQKHQQLSADTTFARELLKALECLPRVGKPALPEVAIPCITRRLVPSRRPIITIAAISTSTKLNPCSVLWVSVLIARRLSITTS